MAKKYNPKSEKWKNWGKWNTRGRCIRLLAAMVLCLSFFCTAVVSGAQLSEEAGGNLLMNPNWENGMEGWNRSAMDEPDLYRGENVFRSSVYQDVSLEGIPAGQQIKLSGNIGVAPEDPRQKAMEMVLTICNADGDVISDVMQDGTAVQYMEAVQEESAEPTYHEIVMAIPPGAAFARVFLTIYKQSNLNPIYFGDLCLEEVTQEEENGFFRSDTTYTVTNLNIPDGAVSFQGHYYYYYDDPDCSWTMARSFCYLNNGHLVTITSSEEQEFLENAFPGTRGWIGASIQEDGSWQWVTDEAFEYTNWNAGEPNNENGTEGHALISTDMKWNDLPEDDTTYHTGYYCEWDSDMVTFERAGLFGGEITEETKSLLEEGKGYYYGTGPEGYDIDKAWSLFADATDDYSALAWYYLGRIMEYGLRDTGKNPLIRAMGAYERAIEYGSGLGWIGQGDLYRDGMGVPVDYQRAMQLYQRAIDLGYAEGNYGMGRLYQFGLGVEPDGEKAIEYYLKAVESSEFGFRNMARDAIGDIYYEGLSPVGQDYTKAMEWYMAGAEEGFASCCNNAGYLYYNGEGTQQDYTKAAYWFELAALHGERDGCFNIGFLYENGIGVEQNYSLAIEYYKKAAGRGDALAMYHLGRIYEEGLGTEKDYDLAREWYEKVTASDEASLDLKETVSESLAWIQSEEAAAAFQDVYNGNGQYYPDQTGTFDYGTYDWNQDWAINYGNYNYNIYYNQDGTIDYGSGIFNQDGSLAYPYTYNQDGTIGIYY